MFNTFSSFFKEEAVAGLDIGDDYISAACLFPEGENNIRVSKLAYIDKKPEYPPKATANLIKKLWQEHRIETRTVCSCFRSPSLTLKYFKFPNLAQDELGPALRLEAEQALQKPYKELFIDWHVYPPSQKTTGLPVDVPPSRDSATGGKCENLLRRDARQKRQVRNLSADNPVECAKIIVENFGNILRDGVNTGATGLPVGFHPNSLVSNKDNDNQSQEGILVVALKEDVKNHLKLLSMADVYPVVLDISSMAIANIFLRLRAISEKESLCLVNVLNRSADVCILFGGSQIYPRNIYSQVDSWREKIDYLINNIEDLMRYYQFKLRNKPINKLIFTGKAVSDEEIKSLLEHKFSVPVEFWNPLQASNFKNLSEKKLTLGLAMATSLGLAMRRG